MAAGERGYPRSDARRRPVLVLLRDQVAAGHQHRVPALRIPRRRRGLPRVRGTDPNRHRRTWTPHHGAPEPVPEPRPPPHELHQLSDGSHDVEGLESVHARRVGDDDQLPRRRSEARSLPHAPDPEGHGVSQARARHDDPWTSWAAARSLGPLRPRQAAIAHLFSTGLSYTLEEAVPAYRAYQSGPRGQSPPQTDSSIRSRIAELMDAGVLEDTGKTRLTRSGRKARVLRLSSHGRLFA